MPQPVGLSREWWVDPQSFLMVSIGLSQPWGLISPGIPPKNLKMNDFFF